jgi:hypothetical protein
MPEIKVRFDPDDLERLTNEASKMLIPRSTLIRNRALGRQLAPADYHRLVSDAAAHLRNDLPRRHVEHLVAFVVSRVLQ